MIDFDIVEILSPNYNRRPAGTIIDMVVIHAISLPPGRFGSGYVLDFFTNSLDFNADSYFMQLKDMRVSSHYFIERSGRVVRFVSDENRAWHAGVSRFAERDNCNDFSVGIELEGDDFTPFTEIQYLRLQKLIATLKSLYPAITDERIVGHCHIAPQRKTDPGPFFEWQRVGGGPCAR